MGYERVDNQIDCIPLSECSPPCLSFTGPHRYGLVVLADTLW